jgi:bla regulator protein BlaR1
MNSSPLADFLGQLAIASGQASILALVVWGVCRLLGDHLAARWRCQLWLLVVVRLALPVSLPSPVSLFNLVGAPVRLASPDAVPFWLPEELAGQFFRGLELPWVGWIWTTVTGVLLLRVVASWLMTVWIRATARPTDSWEAWLLLQECKEVSGLDVPVAILESSRVRTPCLLGFLRPRLILPLGLRAELSKDELRLIFLHELAHLRRRDLAMNWLLAAVEIVHWFNPLAWMVTRRMREDREEACDACALDVRPESTREYALTLLKLIERGSPGVESGTSAGPTPTLAVGVLGTAEEDITPLVHRIRAISRHRPHGRTWVVGFCTWLALVCVGLTDAEPRPASEVPGVAVAEHSA